MMPVLHKSLDLTVPMGHQILLVHTFIFRKPIEAFLSLVPFCSIVLEVSWFLSSLLFISVSSYFSLAR